MTTRFNVASSSYLVASLAVDGVESNALNWVLLASIGVSSLALLFYRENHRRTDLDLNGRALWKQPAN